MRTRGKGEKVPWEGQGTATKARWGRGREYELRRIRGGRGSERDRTGRTGGACQGTSLWLWCRAEGQPALAHPPCPPSLTASPGACSPYPPVRTQVQRKRRTTAPHPPRARRAAVLHPPRARRAAATHPPGANAALERAGMGSWIHLQIDPAAPPCTLAVTNPFPAPATAMPAVTAALALGLAHGLEPAVTAAVALALALAPGMAVAVAVAFLQRGWHREEAKPRIRSTPPQDCPPLAVPPLDQPFLETPLIRKVHPRGSPPPKAPLQRDHL